MGSHDPEIVKKHLKIYLGVFFALIGFTVLTVLAARVHFWGPVIALIVGLGIASTKASLVGWFFMHLGGERKIIWINVLLVAGLFPVLIFLTLGTFKEQEWQVVAPAPENMVVAKHHDDHDEHGEEGEHAEDHGEEGHDEEHAEEDH